ncbi:DUF4180 domain-containing protein [Kitasatospora sp. NPDC094019]|uniref:DUF4180 domain-containing protein n=1 Tax=Kitasatospora sp. NPDC094019 TaxID=3364091 RepID=UPI003819C27B
MSESLPAPAAAPVPAPVVVRLSADGPVVRTPGDGMDLLGEAFAGDAEWLLVPAARFGAEFFTLGTRLAGEVTQKFAQYRVGLAVVGDLTAYTGASGALRDFVRESNRGRQLWFLADEAEFDARIDALTGARNGAPDTASRSTP